MDIKLGKIVHVGICVKDLDETLNIYSKILGFKVGIGDVDHVGCRVKEGEVIPGGKSGVRVAFITTGNTTFEFIEIKDWDKATEKGRRLGIDHVAFLVDDFKKALKILKDNGIEPLEGYPKSDTIAYFRTSEGVKIELFGEKHEMYASRGKLNK